MRILFFRVIYTFILFLMLPVGLFLLLKKKKGKPSVGIRWKEYFAIDSSVKFTLSPIWIHAASVGEVIATTQLIKKIRQNNPLIPILVTTTTPTGFEQVKKTFLEDNLIVHKYMPLDFGFLINFFIIKNKPRLFMIMETELWPNTLLLLKKNNIPIYLINGRLSCKSYNGYKRVPILPRVISSTVSKVFAQYQLDRDNFIKLGFDSSKVIVTGSIKADIDINDSTYSSARKLRKQLGDNNFVWVAASTHSTEDELLLAAHKKLLLTVKNAKLILVARHPERFNSLCEIVNEFELSYINHSDNLDDSSIAENVYIGNVMGELLSFIAAGDVCFVGGSLLGDKVGGHNVLEPAALAKPILIGPSFYNFKYITSSLIDLNVCHICNSPDEIYNKLHMYYSNPYLVIEHGDRELEYVRENSGAISKIVDSLQFT